MEIIETLLAQIPTEPVAVRRVIIGLHWTLVSSRFCGLASTMAGQGSHGQPALRDVGFLHQKSAQELAGWIRSDHLLEASIGMAAINSLLELDESRAEDINAAEIIARECRGKNLAIVGHFPFVERMKSIARNCWVIEKQPIGDDLPESAAGQFLPQADVVAITGTAFINHTIEGLLSSCRVGALVLVLGPSTPLAPKLLDFGVSILSGSRVVDEQAAVATIQQGAIFPQVKGVRLLSISKRPA
jgi:uncharacterized protein (DUF4213/DUF364 family)